MTPTPNTVSNRTLGVLIVAAAAVVVWRIVALGLWMGQVETFTTPLWVKASLAAVGVVYLVCGLLVYLKFPGRAGLLFAAYCICSGLHWGGPVELADGDLRTSLLFIYLIISSVLGTVFLLHLALVFPVTTRVSERRWVMRSLYAPVALAIIFAALYFFSSADSGLRSTSQGLFLGVHFLVSNLFAVLALGIYLSHLIRPGLTRSEKRYVGLVVGSMFVAWLPYLVASSLGVTDTDPWNLTVVALPIAFTVAFFGLGGESDSRLGVA